MNTGELRIIGALDFERPRDANADNVYELTIRASGGGVSRDFPVTLTVTNDKEGISVTRIATGFTNPACVSFLNTVVAPTPSQPGRIAVGEAGGNIYAVDGTTGAKTLLADAFAGRSADKLLDCRTYRQGASGYYAGLYAVLRNADASVVLQRFDRGGLKDSVLLPAGSAAVGIKLLEGSDQQFYAAVGDSSPSVALDAASPLGKLHKLVQYDPYAGASLSPGYFTPQIVGDGLRDPAGGGTINGKTLIADRGGSKEHELDFFAPDARPLGFGWPNYEGTEPLVSSPPAAIIGPTVVYPFGTGARQGTGIVAGLVYDGPANELKAHYVFGDQRGLIWSIPLSLLTDGYLHKAPELENRTADFKPDVGTIDAPVGFATDDLGRFYVLDSDGELFRVDGT
ncbi:MAG: hypothetical protein IE921_09290 [Rhodobacteraceae bacterium]|nr:hypothetical protein [Paracoccaceae bacterium]